MEKRRRFNPEPKAKFELDMLREEQSVAEIVAVHQSDEIYTSWPHYEHHRIRNALKDLSIMISKKLKKCTL